MQLSEEHKLREELKALKEKEKQQQEEKILKSEVDGIQRRKNQVRNLLK